VLDSEGPGEMKVRFTEAGTLYHLTLEEYDGDTLTRSYESMKVGSFYFGYLFILFFILSSK
jgi:hypothetical protein